MIDLAGLSRRLAHDFDNILTGVIGFAELSLAQTTVPDPAKTYLTELLRVCDRGIELTRCLHQFHRLGIVSPELTNAAAIIRAESEKLRSSLPSTVTIETVIADPLPLVMIESRVLRQLFMQVLNNAKEACPADACIRFEASPIQLTDADLDQWLGCPVPGRYVEFRITDAGPGIESDVFKRLFVEPFFSTKPRHRGMGLMLALRAVHANNGGLRLERPAAGGCSVRIVLPSQNGEGTHGCD
jgi:signal transduction histidine kinase